MIACPRCQRANPREAVFCHFDGAELRPVGGRMAPNHLPHDFVFPSGRRCKSYDELVQGCQYEWDDARELLRQGVFTQFFGNIGRMDLARAAQEGQNHPQPDIGLHEFIGKLPAGQVQGPRLDLKPRRLVLGAFRVGDSRQVTLTVSNQGKGLLRGTLTVNEGEQWLRLPEGGEQCSIMTAKEQQITLWVDTHGLVAPHVYSAKLTVITNGGIVEVPVRLDMAAHPFSRPPFQGVGSPREMAEKMRSQPKAAVPLLENGEVAGWFETNGWTYPVQGPMARGVAAVQQFFEGMGLSKPPPVQLSDSGADFLCQPPEVIPGQFTLRTTAKKWVYAHVDSEVAWLTIKTPSVSGPQQAVILYEIDSTLMEPGQIHTGTIQVVANAGQTLEFRVRVDVRRPQEPFTRRLLRPWLAGALLGLLYRLVLAGPADVYARVLAAGPNAPQAPGSFASWLESPVTDVVYVRHFVLASWWLGAVLGAVLLWRRGDRWADVFCGIIAGAVAGLVGSATLACLMPVLDAPPRACWRVLAPGVERLGFGGSPWLWTPLWIVLASGCWAVLGMVAGFLLGCTGERGNRFLARLGRPFFWLFHVFGLKRAEALFAWQ